jgi:hypothetical protein
MKSTTCAVTTIVRAERCRYQSRCSTPCASKRGARGVDAADLAEAILKNVVSDDLYAAIIDR